MKLMEVVNDIQSGFASGLRDDDGIIQLRMNNITIDGRFDFEELLKVPIPTDIEKFDLQKDDIIFNNTNSLDLIGKSAIVNERLDYTFSNHLTRIRVKKRKIIPYWLYLILLRYRERSVIRAICHTHVGQSGIGKKELRNLQIFFPKIEEQQKIVSILSKVDELIQKIDQVIEQTQRLKKGLMQKLLTNGIRHTKFKETAIGKIPQDWDTVEFGQLIEDLRYGTSVKCTTDRNGIPVLRIPNIIHGNIDFEDLKYAVLPDSDIQRYGLREGDIIFIRTNGNREYVGRCAVYHQNSNIHAFASYLIRVRPKVEKLHSDFAAIQFSLPILRKQIFNSAKTSAGQYNINTEGLKSLKMVVPPLSLQQKIVSIIFTIDNLIQLNKNRKAKIENLKKGLMQKLLTGKIRVKV